MFLKLAPHLFGMFTSVVAVGSLWVTIYHGEMTRPPAERGNDFSSVFRARLADDKFAMARVGATKALDREADIRFAYPLSAACRVLDSAGASSSARTSRITAVIIGSSADSAQFLKKTDGGSAAKPCERSGGNNEFLLVASQADRALLESVGLTPTYIAISDDTPQLTRLGASTATP